MLWRPVAVAVVIALAVIGVRIDSQLEAEVVYIASPPEVVIVEVESDGGMDAGPPFPLTDRAPVSPSEPISPRYYTYDEFTLVIANTPWEVNTWGVLWNMLAGCESTADPSLFDDDLSRLDASAVGDHGMARGAAQIRVDAHPDLARSFDLFDLWETLIAARFIYERSGYTFVVDWSCAP